MWSRKAVQFHIILHLIEPVFNKDAGSCVLKLGHCMDLVPFRTLPLHPLHRAILLHPNLYLALHLVAVVSSEDFADVVVAPAVLGVLGVGLVAGVPAPEVASVYPQAIEH